MNHKSDVKSTKKRINSVDAVIAVVFLLSLAAMIYFAVTLAFSEEGSAMGGGDSVEYRIAIENVDAKRFGITLNEQLGTAECDFLKIGDTLYSDENAKVLGKLVSIHYEISTASTGKSDGEGNLVYAELPGSVDLILTVRGELSKDSLTVGDLDLRIGKCISFHTSGYCADAEILSINTEVE